MTSDPLQQDVVFLRGKLQNDPSNWETRRQLAHALYDLEAFEEAAETVWTAEPIPGNDLDLAFAARILSKAQPRRAIRLLAAVLELNRGKAVQNMGMANSLLHHGMVLQAARFYGAALDADPTMVNPELEHFILWTDDELTLWGEFEDRRPKLGDLPWMVRDPKEALRLTSSVKLHSTPLSMPRMPAVPGEQLRQELYQQEAKLNAKITPPPAVTIPINRVDPKYRRFDATFGATHAPAAEQTVVDSAREETEAALVPRSKYSLNAPPPAPQEIAVTSAPQSKYSLNVPQNTPMVTAIPEAIVAITLQPVPVNKPRMLIPGAPAATTKLAPSPFSIPTRVMAVKTAEPPVSPPTRPPLPPR